MCYIVVLIYMCILVDLVLIKYGLINIGIRNFKIRFVWLCIKVVFGV